MERQRVRIRNLDVTDTDPDKKRKNRRHMNQGLCVEPKLCQRGRVTRLFISGFFHISISSKHQKFFKFRILEKSRDTAPLQGPVFYLSRCGENHEDCPAHIILQARARHFHNLYKEHTN